MKKGFTLIELLVVISIIGLLLILVIPNTFKLFDKSLERQFDVTVLTLENAASTYFYNNEELYDTSFNKEYLSTSVRKDNNCYIDKITISKLYDEYLIKRPLINPLTDSEFDEEDFVLVTYNGNALTFNYTKKDEAENVEACNYKSGDNNYVYYSGSTYRILGLDTDGNTKLVLDDYLTINNYGNDSLYDTSYIYSYLNTKYYNNLNNTNNVLTNTSTCVDTISDLNNVTCDVLNVSSVGLLSVSDYLNSKGETESFLNKDSAFFTITPKDNNNVYYVSKDNTLNYGLTTGLNIGIRPVITLVSTTKVTKGNGSENKPFIIDEGNTIVHNQSNLSSRYSGEYVSINNYLFRIVDEKDGYKKLMLADPYYTVKDVTIAREFDKNGSTTFNPEDSSNIGHYLNNDVYEKIFSSKDLQNYTKEEEHTRYLYNSNSDLLSGASSSTYTTTVSIASNNDLYVYSNTLGSVNNMITFNYNGSNEILHLVTSNNISSYFTTPKATGYIKPVVYVDGSRFIVDGEGTRKDPFKIR